MTTETQVAATETPATTSSPAAATKRPAPKKAPKKGAKKMPTTATAKKSAKKTAKKAPAAAKTPREKALLTGNERLVLATLAKNSQPLTRQDLASKTKISKGWSKMLGAATKDVAKDSLEGRGLVKSEKHEDQRAMVYKVTTAGKAMLAKTAE